MIKLDKMRAKKLFELQRTVHPKAGGRVVIFMDLWEVSKPQKGLFLERYKLSWICFDPGNPVKRFLMDAHWPDGLHYHLEGKDRVSVDFETLEEAMIFFKKMTVKIFGEIKESL